MTKLFFSTPSLHKVDTKHVTKSSELDTGFDRSLAKHQTTTTSYQLQKTTYEHVGTKSTMQQTKKKILGEQKCILLKGKDHSAFQKKVKKMLFLFGWEERKRFRRDACPGAWPRNRCTAGRETW